MIGHVFLPNSGSVAQIGYLASFEDLFEKDGEYPKDWGSPILAHLYHALNEVSSGRVVTFNGMWNVLEYWFYYYFHTLVPAIKGNPKYWKDEWPEMKVFNRDQLATSQQDLGKFSKINARKQVNLRSIEGTTWQPWDGSEHATRDELVFSLELSRSRYFFFDIEEKKGYKYLGERCWHQVTGKIAIPHQPPPIEGDTFEMKSCDDYITYASVQDYVAWWSQVSLGLYPEESSPKKLVRKRVMTLPRHLKMKHIYHILLHNK
ncbi:hypothetical protein MKW94_021775 [Papaver nudicaule]|uniref:Aminotransferase-like plant mobile domain-containing protein n=1 Tax=Papaver nudicaule TaxID=74823 RepID=A0AA41VM13_PAPNU|nr:hypothetical protein [Papaver nudicaule]